MNARRFPEALLGVASVLMVIGAVVGLVQGTDEGSDADGGTDMEASGEGSGGAEVAIVDFSFDPEEVSVSVGDTVTWTNQDTAEHNVIAEEGAPGESSDVPQGETYEFTFEEAGDFAYICNLHPNMEGTVTVEEGA